MSSYLLEIGNIVETSLTNFNDMFIHFYVFIKNNTKVEDLITRIIANFDIFTK